MYYVYLLQSVAQPEQRYIGFTADLKNRSKAHNAGRSIHTVNRRVINGEQVHRVADLAMGRKPSVDFSGY